MTQKQFLEYDEKMGKRFVKIEKKLDHIEAEINKKVDKIEHNTLKYRVKKLEEKFA
jgi:repressor of nif and glnA expression